ncbi:MAG: phospholipid carrier-dependent glycosyltransferase [Gemmatimonadales bacterium]
MPRKRRLVPTVSLTLCLVALAYDIGGYPLLDPDEGRNAEVAREMASTNNFIVPHLNGVPYVDKPMLFFGAVAAVMKVLGPTVTAARLPSLVFTLLTLAVVFWFGRRTFGAGAAWIATIASAATPFTLAYSRTVIFDSTLTFFVVVAIVGFFMAIDSGARIPAKPPHETGADWWMSLTWVAMACGVLTKGPIALAVPLMIAIPYAAWRRGWRSLGDTLSILLFVALVLPWVLAMSREVPGFVHYVLWTETIARLTTGELHRTGPLWYFLVILPAATLPWSLILLGGMWRARPWRRPDDTVDKSVIYLLLWIIVPLAFFSLSQSKRPQYVLPLVPAVGLLLGALWTRWRTRLYGARTAAVAMAVLGVALLTAHGSIANLLAASPGIAAAVPAAAAIIGIGCIVGGVLAYVGVGNSDLLLLGFAIPIIAIPVSARTLMDEIGRTRSAAEISAALLPEMSDDVQVVGVHAFPPSLPFYLNRPLILSTKDGAELTSNYIVRHYDEWSGTTWLRDAGWWRQALIRCVRPRVFIVRSNDRDARELLDQQLNLVIDTGKYAAYGPCGFSHLATVGP